MPLSSMTKLEAVNEILSGVDHRPVNEIGDNATGRAAQAEKILDQSTRYVLNEGFYFNAEFEVELALDVSGEISVPSTYTRTSISRKNTLTLDVVQRGTKLYNRTDGTFIFTSPVKVDAWIFLEFVDLPESVKIYVTARALGLMGDRMYGDNARHGQMARDTVIARNNVVRDEEENQQFTIFDHPDIGFGIKTRPNVLTRLINP